MEKRRCLLFFFFFFFFFFFAEKDGGFISWLAQNLKKDMCYLSREGVGGGVESCKKKKKKKREREGERGGTSSIVLF